jgi:RNA polymerase sigma factor (sigma-70 family)
MVSLERWRTAPRAAGFGRVEGGQEEEALLLQAALAGDRAAIARLLAPYERRLYVLCRGILGHTQDAEDAVQETFLRALNALPRFRGDAPVRAWLFRIAVNVCLDWKRARRPTEPWDEAHPLIPPDTTTPEGIVLRQLRVMEALHSLLPRHRAILLLKELDGWSVAEIAAAFGWNKDRVRNELSRARRALADWRQRDAGEGDEG